ncbi:hypothetical protein GF337_13460 [candidate division KSB1 bacterium]|nr:hypothetical protein [candidate division KSB1 bacterium]
MMRRITGIATIVLLLLCIQAGLSQQGSISVESKVDRAKITIGDRIQYSIIITKDENIEVEFPEFGANLGSFEILDYNDPEPVRQDGKVVLTKEYTISTFVTGEFEIPPATIRFGATDDTTWQELSTESIKIVVESLQPSEEGDIREIKAPLELERDYRKMIRIGAVALILILIALLTFYFIKRRREGKSLIPVRQKPPRPPHEIALEELDRLTKSDLIEKGEIKLFYIELSEIIRKYIEGRFYIVAIEMTTYDLLNNMEEANIDREVIDMVAEFLHQCDFVKFAKYIPSDEENQKAVQLAYDIVNTTKIVVQEDESAEDEKDAGAKETEASDDEMEAVTGEPAEKEVE